MFRANDKHGFLVAVEAKVKKNGPSAPKISVVCGLKQFDLVLIAPGSFLELNFEKVEFSVTRGEGCGRRRPPHGHQVRRAA